MKAEDITELWGIEWGECGRGTGHLREGDLEGVCGSINAFPSEAAAWEYIEQWPAWPSSTKPVQLIQYDGPDRIAASEVWLRAWCAAITRNDAKAEGAANCADYCVQEFRKRFSTNDDP